MGNTGSTLLAPTDVKVPMRNSDRPTTVANSRPIAESRGTNNRTFGDYLSFTTCVFYFSKNFTKLN